MTKRKWPDGNEPLNFESLSAPLLRAVRFAYTLKRKNQDKNIPWNGPGVGEDTLAYCPNAKEKLKAANLQYCEEDQGRDALEEIIGLALQLGIEQGRRITMNSPEVKTLEIYGKIGKLLSEEKLKEMEEQHVAD